MPDTKLMSGWLCFNKKRNCIYLHKHIHGLGSHHNARVTTDSRLHRLMLHAALPHDIGVAHLCKQQCCTYTVSGTDLHLDSNKGNLFGADTSTHASVRLTMPELCDLRECHSCGLHNHVARLHVTGCKEPKPTERRISRAE